MIAICAMIKDEADYLPEWLSHHRAIGVDRFFLYDNESEVPVRAPARDVEVVRWPYTYVGAQLVAFLHCARTQRKCSWIVFIDLDEFIVLRNCEALADFVANYRTPAIALNWRCYGSSGLETRPPNHWFYSLYGGSELPINQHVKSIVRPAYVTRVPPNPHYLGVETCNELHRPVTGSHSPHTSEMAFVKHTMTRSREEFAQKIRRGGANSRRSIYNMESFDEFNSYLNAYSDVEERSGWPSYRSAPQ